MKNNKIQILLAAVGMSFLWVGCQKEASVQTQPAESVQTEKAFGADQVDPEKLMTVPLIMSSDFAQKGYDVSGAVMVNGRGKPVKPPTTTGDATAPTVTITSPSNGATITGYITIAATATDNVGVTSVNFTVDGTVVATFATAPYSVSWNSQYLGDGNHTIACTAKDAAGNTTTNAITVSKGGTIVVQPPPPTGLPSSYSLVMPPVIQQGSEGSCISVAVSYARSYEAYKRSGATSYSQSTNILSPEYLFNQVKSSTTCTGSALLTNLNFVRDNGICTWATMPYTWSNGCSLMPNSTQTTEASKYRITSYSQVYASDITAIKTMVAANRPLVSQYTVDQQFYNAGPGFIWKTFGGAIGSHGLVICGYDDAKNAFKVINQWGTTWGDAGYSWIDYNFLKSVSSNLFVMNF